MTRADLIGGLLLAVFFGAALWEGWSFQYGTEFAPGPGFAPVWLSSIGIVIALAITVGGWRSARLSSGSEQGTATADEAGSHTAGLIRVVATLLALAVMIAVVSWIGFVPAMLAFLLVLTLGIQRLSWLTSVGVSAGTVLFIYAIFVYFLRVPIPAGPLGF